MIFQHTLEQVLLGAKVQTSRIWKDDYTFSYDEYDRELPNVILSIKAFDAGKIRRLYQVGQVVSVQPSRGQKGVAKIRILQLAKRDVRDFTAEDFTREGFRTGIQAHLDFLSIWSGMHDKANWIRRDTENWQDDGTWLIGKGKKPERYDDLTAFDYFRCLPDAQYTALVINFKLVD